MRITNNQKLNNKGVDHLKSTRASAMIIALALVVLMSIIVVTFLLQTRVNQMVVSSSNSRDVAEISALGVADQIINQLAVSLRNTNTVAGVVAGTNFTTTVQTPTGNAAYWPLTGNGARMPRTVVMTGNALTNFPTLIRQSVSNATSGGDTNASSDIAANGFGPAAGRKIGINRWMYSQLTFGNYAVTAGPNWIYVSRGTGITNKVTNNTMNPMVSTIGAYAYQVYDMSGLINVNALANTTTSPAPLSMMGSLAAADLSMIGITPTNRTALVQVLKRSADGSMPYLPFSDEDFQRATALSGGNMPFLRKTNANSNNFQVDKVVYNPFTSRQDLMRYMKSRGLTNAMPYLTHFSRHVMAPSWGPLLNTNAPYNYQANAISAAATNRYFPSALVENINWALPRVTGELVKSWDPLVKYKFPLDRLALISPTGATTANFTADRVVKDINYLRYLNNPSGSPLSPAQIVEQTFGLTYDTDHWVYADTYIRTLNEVANVKREPNFFELLKAGILNGSIGQKAVYDDATVLVSNTDMQARDADVDRQIIQIGANAIEQVSSATNHTRIQFNTYTYSSTNEIVGVKDLPMIYGFTVNNYRPSTNDPTIPSETINGWIQPVFWTPHNSSATPASAPYEVTATGTVTMTYVDPPNPDVTATVPIAATISGSLNRSQTAPQVIPGTNGFPVTLSGVATNATNGYVNYTISN
ncbi:MAG: hypothetical protein ABI615_03230, partial [Chthoniobacterales bacterium]